jgi:hypothetical protein
VQVTVCPTVGDATTGQERLVAGDAVGAGVVVVVVVGAGVVVVVVGAGVVVVVVGAGVVVLGVGVVAAASVK